MDLRIEPEVSRLHGARACVRVFLVCHGVAAEVIEDVLLCMQEAAKNAMRFGDCEHPVTVEISLEGGDVTLIVRDEGAGFDPTTVDIGALPDPLNPQGRGLYLIAALMDDVRICSPGGTEIHMRKSLA